MSEIKLRRPIERWQNCDPNVMAMQSEAALRFAFSDMRHDILALHKELERLRAQVAELVQERDRLRQKILGHNQTCLNSCEMDCSEDRSGTCVDCPQSWMIRTEWADNE